MFTEYTKEEIETRNELPQTNQNEVEDMEISGYAISISSNYKAEDTVKEMTDQDYKRQGDFDLEGESLW